MSLARAMTKRIKRKDDTPQPIKRTQISAPVALLSTTNMLSYEAPDIAVMQEQKRMASSTSKKSMESHGSADESDTSASTVRSRSSSNGSSRDTLTDASSVGSSPTSPEPNHLSAYFPPQKSIRRSASTGEFVKSPKPQTIEEAPAVPERALSHSKRAHERVARQRSLNSMKSIPSLHKRDSSNRSSREHRTSADMFRATITEEPHPFGKELEQLNEVAEEFSNVIQSTENDEDMAAMNSLNLGKFCAADYLKEIRPFDNPFTRHLETPQVMWI